VLPAELGSDNIRVRCVLFWAVLTDIDVQAGLTTAAEQQERLKALGPLHVLGPFEPSGRLAT